jgi:uncharacterized protein (DUF1778 family)
MTETVTDIRKRRLFLRISTEERDQYQAAADAARKRLSTWVRETLGKASEGHAGKGDS